MRYSAIMENDIVNGEDVCVSFWTQGCPHHCPGCHNPETWDFNGGLEKPKEEILNEIIEAIPKNGFNRNFSILGGEPLCQQNITNIYYILNNVKKTFPTIKIFIWTGYTIEELKAIYKKDFLDYFFSLIDFMIVGRYEKDKRDITLKWRGSTNQEIIDFSKKL